MRLEELEIRIEARFSAQDSGRVAWFQAVWLEGLEDESTLLPEDRGCFIVLGFLGTYVALAQIGCGRLTTGAWYTRL